MAERLDTELTKISSRWNSLTREPRRPRRPALPRCAGPGARPVNARSRRAAPHALVPFRSCPTTRTPSRLRPSTPRGPWRMLIGSIASATAGARAHRLNVHKGYTMFRRRFMLHELREAVRAVGSDLVFLQEVVGRTTGGAGRTRRRPAHGVAMRAVRIPGRADLVRARLRPQRGDGRTRPRQRAAVEGADRRVSEPRRVGRGAEPRGMLHCVLRLPAGAASCMRVRAPRAARIASARPARAPARD